MYSILEFVVLMNYAMCVRVFSRCGFICWALLGPGPCWAHSFVGPWWAPGPVGAIHLLGLLGPFLCWALLGPTVRPLYLEFLNLDLGDAQKCPAFLKFILAHIIFRTGTLVMCPTFLSHNFATSVLAGKIFLGKKMFFAKNVNFLGSTLFA